eukprot:4366169-Pyramimonas_sp.AAC.1
MPRLERGPERRRQASPASLRSPRSTRRFGGAWPRRASQTKQVARASWLLHRKKGQGGKGALAAGWDDGGGRSGCGG